MTKKTFNSKKNTQWEYEETPETKAALAALHAGIRQRKMKEQDDQLNYDTGSK